MSGVIIIQLRDQLLAATASKQSKVDNERDQYETRFDDLTRDSQLAILQRDARIAEFQDAEFWLRLKLKDIEV